MSENEEDVEITSCAFCKVLFSKDFISQIKENKGNLFCEYCGEKIDKMDYITMRSTERASNDQNEPIKSIKKEDAPSTIEEATIVKEEITPTKEEIEEQLKVFVFRRVYELLKDPHYILKLKKEQKDLDAYQLKVMAGLLRSRLIHLPFEEEWLLELSPVHREVFEYYNDNFTRDLKSKKYFRKQYMEFFQDAIQLIFGLIKGYPPKAGFQEIRFEILSDLKKVFGFSFFVTDFNTFELQLTLFLAAKLYYSKSFREKVLNFFDKPEELNQVVDKFVLENACVLEKEDFLRKWINTLKRVKKMSFKTKLNNLLSEMKTDYVFCESFLDHFEGLIRIILELVRGEYQVSQLDEVKLCILNFLLSTDPFINDQELQYPFLSNFMIVLSRIVRRRLHNNQELMTKSIAKASAKVLLEDISTRKILNCHLHHLNGISQEVFEEKYAKVQFKITHDRIYRGNFSKFLYTLFITVFKLIDEKCDPNKLSEEECLILKDLLQYLEPLETREIDDLSPNSIEKSPESLESCSLSAKIKQSNDSSISIDQPQISSNPNSLELLNESENVKKEEIFEDDRENYSKKLNIFLDSKKKDIIEGRFVPTKLNIVAEKNEFKNYKDLNKILGIWIKKNTKFKNLTELKKYFSKIELMSEQEKQKSEELIKVGERKSKQFKNIFTEENQESQTFMTNNQVKKEQEKSVLTITKFLDEELEFLKEEHISIHDSDSKWSWLTNELAEKYFISVLLPYYIIKPNLTYEDLNQLSFHTLIYKLQRRTQGIRFSYIKNKYLNLNKQELIKILNKNFGTDKTNKKLENAKRRLESLFDSISAPSISRNRDKLKLFFDLEIYPIKCKECDISVNLLVALELHHFEGLKEIELGDIYFKSEKEYNFLLEKFKKETIELLCRNHHLERQLFYPIIFKEVIFKKDLFSMLAEEIDIYIDNFLSIFVKTKNCKEILYRKYISNNLNIPSDINSKWKYEIKKWIKKRFVFNELFNGKCVVCGDSNLSHLGLHHLNPNLKDLINFWKSISHLDCDEIMRKIIEEKCVCLCANCHALITYKYYVSIREVLKGYFPHQEIDRLSKEITLKYNTAMEKISNFNYDLEKINFICPLKLEFPQDDIWKIHLMMIYYYLEIKKRSFFFRNEILYDLELPRGFVEQSIEKLIDIGYIYKSNSKFLQYHNSKFLIRYSLTEKGKEKSLILIQKYKEKSNKINDLIKKCLNNKGRYEFLNYAYSKKKNCFQKKTLYSKEEINFKYSIIIYNFIKTKGKNEFYIKEIMPLFNNKNNIESDLHLILIPLNLIEKVKDSLYQIYKLTEKGINFAKSIEEI